MIPENIKESSDQQSKQRDRIRIDVAHHPIYKALAKESENEDGENQLPFESMKNLFMLATFIGYQEGKQVSLGKSQGIFGWSQFSDEEDVPLLRALALVETGDIEVLTDQGRILDIAEKYANAGIIEIKEKIADMRDNKIMHLVSLLGARIPDDLISDLAEDVN